LSIASLRGTFAYSVVSSQTPGENTSNTPRRIPLFADVQNDATPGATGTQDEVLSQVKCAWTVLEKLDGQVDYSKLIKIAKQLLRVLKGP
jgi:hypothetical protein